MTNQPRRRAEDEVPVESNSAPVEGSTESKPRKRRRSTRDLLTKFRQPIIGLGLAGAAAPMIANDKDAPQAGPAETPGAQLSEATPTGEIAAAGADLEEKIANQIGEERADTRRDEAVTYAIGRYGIASDLAQEIYDAASEAGIDHKLAYGLVKTESSFKTTAVSHVGARGLTQVMPKTARWLRPGTRAEDLFDRKTNLSLGFNYLNQLIGKYRGDVKLALTAYNRGPGTVDKVLRRGGNPDNGYAGKVIKG
jgi:soluble lytic murein transglycosylase-like protein